MSTINIFEQATRLKLRFDSPKGDLSVEDLWDLPLTSTKGPNLDDIAKKAYAETQSLGNIASFVETPAPVDGKIQLRFDVVLHVINVRKAENAEKADAKAKADKRQKILEAIDAAEGKALSGLSADELRAQLAAL
jgi:hypothetical protein